MNPFQLLKFEFGTLAHLANLLCITESAIYMWTKKKNIPVRHLRKIEELSQGRVTKEMLRPDLFAKENEVV
jgi:DNA-binding transcriptional regulator YdaS (Cro superfamily)